MPPEWSDIRKSLYAESKVKRLIDHEEAAGWALAERPAVFKIKVVNDDDWQQDSMFAGMTIRPDHPWYRPDTDLYMVFAPMRRGLVEARLDLPEWWIKEQLDNGWTEDNISPGWRVDE